MHEPPLRSDAAEPSRLALSAGALHTTLSAGRLLAVCVGEHELWHGVSFLLRDAHWRTPALLLEPPVHEVLDGGWRLVQRGWFEAGEHGAAVPWRLAIEGREGGTGSGQLIISAEACAKQPLTLNRLGLCLLHPLGVCGHALEVLHDDGRLSHGAFPTLISPVPPFTAVRALRHEYAPDAWARAEFEGDSFELEDQRNNADASFKTYSRSNFLPRPYRLQARQSVRQRLVLSVESMPALAAVRTTAGPRRHNPVHTPGARPELRLGIEVTCADLASPAALEHCVARLASLKPLKPQQLHLCWRHGEAALDAVFLAHLLSATSCSLRLDVLDLPEDSEPAARAALSTLAASLRRAGVVPSELAVFPTTTNTVAAARAAFAPANEASERPGLNAEATTKRPRVAIGGGTPAFFVQLNRAERLPPLDFLSFTVCPIVHAADDDTVNTSHASLSGMLATLEARYPGVPVHIGPSGIAARGSPLGDLAASDGTRRVPLAGCDPRQGTVFEADWLAAHVAAAREAGAAAVSVVFLGLSD